ncbi:MAG: tRNA (guanine(46)-N(7))-methyltransferase TrmB [Alphaproteobacteria bacterium]|jgi:tRNA (guanine-N7-)-methyltransferase|nr:tRNA (guanine(46)-N(7))-methyltransferase TrmB [Alphaproteobacteria bacterium]
MEAFLPFYGRRKGRPLRNTSKRLLEELLPAYVVPDNASDPAKLFTHNPRKLYLEIGFGGGEHLAMVAKNHPENAYIGAEPFLNGVSSFLKYCQNEALKNVRIWPDDIRLQLSSWPNECLDGIFIMFPDPWPKIRHSSRRIINKDNLAAFARLIKLGGRLRMASDHASAKNWILSGMLENPYFDWTAESPDDWNVQPLDCPETRYMRKALKEGRRPAWFDFKRVLVEPS